jgi:superfamily II DNA or RNA helicase
MLVKIIKNSPTFIRLEDISDSEMTILKSILAYKNLNTQYLYQQAKKNKFQYNRDPDNWHAYVLKLKSEIDQTALFKDLDGYYTYAGLHTRLKDMGLVSSYEDNISPPSPKLLPWDINYKPLQLYKYQEEAVNKLLETAHSSIELPTGAGKTEVIKALCKNTGLRTVIITPFTAIAKQMYDDFVQAFGKKYIGLYGDGKKQLGKQITISIAASLSKLKEDTEAWEDISSRDVLIVDESHLIGAPTLAEILLKLCADIPYRWSVSATQMRNNGTDLLLEGLINDVVYRKQFKELSDQGYLSPLKFRIFNVWSNNNYSGTNPLKVKQEHYLYNPTILQLAAEVANMRVAMGESVLILIDELAQVDKLKTYLNTPYDVASSETDVAAKVEEFNQKKIPLLIGTSAVSTGANFKPVETLILLMEGKSEIKYKQALGRATRLYPGKKFCNIIDFCVDNIYQLKNHFEDRLNIYHTLTDDIEYLETDEHDNRT